MNIRYYKLRFRLASPLAVGSGETVNTDSDVILDSLSRPMIPATAIAGVIRHECETEGGNQNALFGCISGEHSINSKIRFYDAVPASDSFVTVRDMVALEKKVGKDGAKFDSEAVETNAEFVTLFELRDATEQETALFLNALSALAAGHLRFGAKTSRGYGQIEIKALQKAEFNLPEQKSAWLKFEPFDYDADAYYSAFTLPEYQSRFLAIHLDLQQNGAVSIRSYIARNRKDVNIGDADYEQLTMSDDVPVIPGTSWAGAFRDRFCEFAADDAFTKEVFGFVDEKTQTQQKSKVYFSESRIFGHERKIITRNSIDRFSAATRDGALYTENTVYNGKCGLDIVLQKDISDLERAEKIMLAVIRDLHNGYLAVGGLTAVGRGLFTVENLTIDGEQKTELLGKGGV